jgi:hypothetical protein
MAKKPDRTSTQGKGEIVLYQSPDGKTSLEVRLDGDTLWLSQKQLSDLFQTERSIISKYLGNIFRSGELERNSVCANLAHTTEREKVYPDVPLAFRSFKETFLEAEADTDSPLL